MNGENLKQKTFKIVSKMESDGWELLVLDTYTNVSRATNRVKIEWFAILIKENIQVYVEFEEESTVWMRDVKKHCPECHRLQYDGTIEEGGESCPDCNVEFIYKKEIVEDYYKFDNSSAG